VKCPSQLAKIQWPWALDTRHLEQQQLELDKGLAIGLPFDLTPQKITVLASLRAALPTVVDILTGASLQFSYLMLDWDDILGKRSHKTSDFELSFRFFGAHSRLLDAVDKFLIQSVCAVELGQLVQNGHNTITHSGLQDSNHAFGPGSAILAYHALGLEIGISGEQAYQYASQGLVTRIGLPHELAWEAMRERILITTQGETIFTRTHRVPDRSVELNSPQILPGPLLEVIVCIPIVDL
jgi:hypothetical protein